jgi:flagellar hook-associated protein 1 FlgK
MSQELLDSGYNIAASNEEIQGSINWGNNENLKQLVNLRDNGNFEEDLRSTVSDLAITTNYFNSRSESQNTLTDHIQNQKMSISEVSIDEEMMNLVQYQHSYSAAAKLVNVVDEMLMTLINMK